MLAAATTGIVAAVIATGVPTRGLSGWFSLVVLGLLGLAIPSSRHLSRRIVNVIVVISGLTPLLWWIHMTNPSLRTGIIWGIVVGALIGCIVEWVVLGRPWRNFLPDWNVIDAYPILTGAGSVLVFWNFFISKSALGTLSILVTTWDFAPHFNMYAMLRRYGTVIPLLPLSNDGSAWTAATYPQGVHALMATIAGVVAGPSFSGNDAETLLFLRLVGVIGVLSAVLVVASVTSVPALRHQPLVSLPLAVLVASAWLVGPGSIPVFNGFPNFALGVAVCVALLSVMRLQHQSSPVRIAVLFAASVVSIAHNWILLLVLCIPSSLVIIGTEARKFRQRSLVVQTSWYVAGVVAFVGAGLAAWQLKQLAPGAVLTTPGGITQPDWGLGMTFICTCAAVFSMLVLDRAKLNGPSGIAFVGRLGTIGSALFGGLTAIGFGVWQLLTSDHLSYYFYKFGLAALMLAIAAAAIACGEILVPRISKWASSGRRTIMPLAFVSLGAVSVFGWPTPALNQEGLVTTAPGARARATQDAVLASTEANPGPAVSKLLALSHSSEKSPFIYVGYVEGLDPMLAAQWSLTLQGKWTEGSQQAIPFLSPLYRGPSQVPQAIEGVLSNTPSLKVAVDQYLVPELRRALPSYSDRILGV
ncbi:hypothetical protein GCM10012320_11500 [Sinomonas cellulolyticus]|uniref:Uncharacterized protein n=1 Tax=Sinomonas cellulolyticus TaxID=2801916 RepID=A0ABS1K4K8_9MICC|nr:MULTISPECIES: hypothetical protein [Sinomonas]MBL0706604.1 hypothetical protein [Sinomonas cellulolyticus]GHG45563.1 hypothetical protein GCM10012320_11500 [Sinomonas sp. KCTC 49339]